MKIKDELQKFFDKEIVCIQEKDSKYYVVLDDGYFIKPIYEVDGSVVKHVGIPAPIFASNEYNLIYTRDND